MEVNNETILREFSNDLQNFNVEVMEIREKQEFEIKRLEQIQKAMLQEGHIETVDTLLQIIRLYKEKLCIMRNRMVQIHSRAKNTKDQSLRIQQISIERYTDRAEKRFYEESLISKSSAKSTNKPSIEKWKSKPIVFCNLIFHFL